jgi:hypothetical protein
MLAVVGATVLLAGLVGSASAGRLSTSSQRLRATWARLNFSGGFGTLECEVVVEGSFHERTISKTTGTLSGFITAANITRCASGAGTVLRETLPWHVRYASFTGTLPNISTIAARIIGAGFSLRDPGTGATCLVRAATSVFVVTFLREASGATSSVSASGVAVCRGILEFEGELTGTTTNVDDRAGNRITVTLI